MATSFNGWGGSWGDSWGPVVFDPNAMEGDASFAVSASGTLSVAQTDTIDGYWYKQWEKLHKKKPKIEEVIELVQEQPATALAEVKEVVRREYPNLDYTHVLKNVELQRFIAQQLLVAIESRKTAEEDDIETILMLL